MNEMVVGSKIEEGTSAFLYLSCGQFYLINLG